MRYGAAISGLLHTTIVLLILVGLPKILQSERKGVVPVAVEIVSQDEFARLPEPRKQVPPKPPLDAPVKPTMQNSPKQTDKSPGPSPISATKTSPPVPINLKTELLPKPKRKPDSKTRSPKPKPKPVFLECEIPVFIFSVFWCSNRKNHYLCSSSLKNL